MKGFVVTPPHVVDFMVGTLFGGSPPTNESSVLDPGSGTGAFLEGIVRWCRSNSTRVPRIVAVEADRRHEDQLRAIQSISPSIGIKHEDFLEWDVAEFDYIIGNPPYVPITSLTDDEKRRYRSRFSTAVGRFDLYLLFFEQALRVLSPGGRLVLITPEKYLYVESAGPLRRLLAGLHVKEIRLLSEDVFGTLITYPTVTVVENLPGPASTRVTLRDGRSFAVTFPRDGSSWLPYVLGEGPSSRETTLKDACSRISCGVATGADSVFLARNRDLSSDLAQFAYPTVAGRELKLGTIDLPSEWSLLVPYDKSGRLLPEHGLRGLRDYLSHPSRRTRLDARTCVAYKPWYAFHETPPIRDLMKPKLLCKDITSKAAFWIDRQGAIVPRHSVYYLVPKEPSRLDDLAEYLRSKAAQEWLNAHCQRAANGFLRVQSSVLKRMPVPRELVPESGPTLALSTSSVFEDTAVAG